MENYDDMLSIKMKIKYIHAFINKYIKLKIVTN